MSENKVGRPTVMDEITIKKLEECFAIGGSDAEACFYAGISKQTLYTYQDNNPEFLDRKNALKEKPILKARQEVVKGLEGNPEFSLKYLERKRKDEFSTKTETDTNLKVQGKIDTNSMTPQQMLEYIKEATK